jgi:hypothetical protein
MNRTHYLIATTHCCPTYASFPHVFSRVGSAHQLKRINTGKTVGKAHPTKLNQTASVRLPQTLILIYYLQPELAI